MRNIKIGLIAESSYPYRYGGVGNCIEQTMRLFPDKEFEIICLLDEKTPEIHPSYLLSSSSIKAIHNINIFRPLNRDEGIGHKQIHSILKLIENILIKNIQTDLNSFFEELLRHGHEENLKEIEIYKIIEKFILKNFNHVDFVQVYYFITHNLMALIHVSRTHFVDYDIIHSFSNGYAGLIASLIRDRSKSKMILSEHGIYLDELKFQQSLNKKNLKYWNKFMTYLCQWNYQQADEITTLTQYNKIRIEHYYSSDTQKISIMSNAPYPLDKQVIKQLQHNKTAGKLKIGWVGRVVPIKNTLRFIEMISLIKADFEAKIIGSLDDDTIYARKCLNLVDKLNLEERVSFTGFIDSLDQIYEQFDILFVSSNLEGQPLVILEAMQRGKPIISYDICGCSEIILFKPEKPAGIILDTRKKPQEHAMEIDQFIQNENQLNFMSKNASDIIENHFTLDLLRNSLEEVYFS